MTKMKVLLIGSDERDLHRIFNQMAWSGNGYTYKFQQYELEQSKYTYSQYLNNDYDCVACIINSSRLEQDMEQAKRIIKGHKNAVAIVICTKSQRFDCKVVSQTLGVKAVRANSINKVLHAIYLSCNSLAPKRK